MESEYKNLILEKKDRVGMITMYNPPENRFVLSMLKEIRAAFSRFDQDEDVFLIMLKGKGESFCRGGDVETIHSHVGWDATEFFQNVAETAKAVRNTKKTTMAVVDGWATAGGGILANACDLVVASENSAFGATAVNFGYYVILDLLSFCRLLALKKHLNILRPEI